MDRWDFQSLTIGIWAIVISQVSIIFLVDPSPNTKYTSVENLSVVIFLKNEICKDEANKTHMDR